MITKSEHVTTAEQLLALPDDGNRYELVKGILKMMSPAGNEHGRVTLRIAARLAMHVEKFDLGETYAVETGFRISNDPDTVRAPDAAYVSHARLQTVEPTRGYLPLAPDLVVEVVSPNDRSSDIEAKAHQWLTAGSAIVLVADPENLTIRVYENPKDIRVLCAGDTFESGKVCGGWKLTINDAFQISK